MVFVDWTQGGTVTISLDAGTKYAGTSSVRFYKTSTNIEHTGTLTHNTFLESQAQIIGWCRRYVSGLSSPYVLAYVGLVSYGNLDISPASYSTWEKFRATFWYDAGTNTKWGRVEKWDGSAWGTAVDTNMGSGSPAASALKLTMYYNTSYSAAVGTAWFDELEVYS